jgi:hypothetical protein
MQNSQLIKNILKYLPVLAVFVATVIGLLIGKDLYPISIDTQPKTPLQSRAEPNNLQLLIIPGTESLCGFSNIYTSLPPKCKTLDGKFIPIPGSSYITVLPEGK